MAVSFQKLKVWGGKEHFGVSKGAGESKKGLIKKLVEAMKDNLDELDEEQLAWLEEQTGESLDKPKKKKKKKAAVEEKPAKKKKKKKKVKEEEPEEEEEAEEEEEPTRGVSADVEPKELRAFAKALDIPFKGWKKFEVKDWEDLANEIYAKVDNMDDDEKEELPEEVFAWYSTIKGVEEEGAEEKATEVEVPSKPKLKRFAAAMGIDTKGKSDKEVAAEILEDFQDLDEEDYDELPETLVEWAKGQLGGEEEGEELEVELPDYDTLKAYAKEVGIKFKDIKKLKDDPQALAEAITDAYDSDDEDEYSEELREFYATLCGEGEAEAEEEEEESMAGQLTEWLEEAGYDPDDMEGWTDEQLTNKLAEDYQNEEDRDDIPEDAVAFLKEARPDLFEQEKKPKKKKKKKK